MRGFAVIAATVAGAIGMGIGALAVTGRLSTLAAAVPSATARPTGMVPVAYRDAEIFVPRSWAVADGPNEGLCSSGIVVLVGGARLDCTGHDRPRGTLVIGPAIAHPGGSWARTTVAGFSALTTGHRGICHGPTYVVPSLDVLFTLCDAPKTVLGSLRLAPRGVVLRAGPAGPTPRTWHWTSFDGLRFATPAGWRGRTQTEGCPWSSVTSGHAPGRLVLLRPWQGGVPACATPPPTIADPHDELVVGGTTAHGDGPHRSLRVNGLSAVSFTDRYVDDSGVLDLEVSTATRRVLVRLSFSPTGDGQIGRLILGSLHRA